MSRRRHLEGQWNAPGFFRSLTEANILAREHNFIFCTVSGLQGLEQALQYTQGNNFVFLSDISDGYMELNNTPHTRRIKTVFFAMRHAVDDLRGRERCMNIMRELFRQFMSRLIPEKIKLEENHIYLDDRIAFNEIDRYFFKGCACAYFQIAVDIFTDLRLNEDEWLTEIKFSPSVIYLTKENDFTADVEVIAPGKWNAE